MSEYEIRCTSGVADVITARREGDSVKIRGSHQGEYAIDAFTDPDTARTFARGILVLADEIDGGEVAEEAPKRTPQVGDRVRILVDCPSGADVRTGEIHTVCEVDGRIVRVPGGGFRSMWHVSVEDVEIVDEPTPEPTSDPRAELITRADKVMESTGLDYTAADVIALARFLAGE
ncbi:hypothetical protein ABTY96_03155 [Streptomyces sp. NPDC096057]|uniref:hypothetical protein n=1 Tax=Streptomyces sp. NPDC096057 TaxID=3155543 RepID=UPI003317AFE9